VIPGRDDLSDQMTGGSVVDALLTPSLLETIFTSHGPLHDGAVVVESGRIAHAGVVLPLSSAEVPDSFGTRHRAALGLSEASDAIVVCVSEERGEVSVAARGIMTEAGDADRLVAALAHLRMDVPNRERKARTPDASLGEVRHRRRFVDAFAYVAILVGVVGAWSATVLDSSRSLARSVALEFHGLDDSIGFDPPTDDTAVVELRGPTRVLDVLPANRITAFIDLAHATPGRHLFPIGAKAPDGVKIVSVIPASIEVDVLERREVAVEAAPALQLPPGLRIVALVPNKVQLVGSAAAFRGVGAILTEPLAPTAQPVVPGNVELRLALPKGLRVVDSRQQRVVAVIGGGAVASTLSNVQRGRAH
jgi:diadenylate cyclase